MPPVAISSGLAGRHTRWASRAQQWAASRRLGLALIAHLLIVLVLPNEWPSSNAIYAGKRANVSDWPFYAFLEGCDRPCGAVVVRPRYILTTASCLLQCDLSQLAVRVGAVDPYGGEGVIHTISHVCKSSGFRIAENPHGRDEYLDDFALLLTRRKIAFNDNVGGVNLNYNTARNPETSWATGAECYVIGSGKRNQLDQDNLLHSSPVKVRWCEKAAVRDKKLCYKHRGSVTGVSCDGDQGGPVVCIYGKSFVLVGLVSSVAQRCNSWAAAQQLNEAAKISRFLKTSFNDCLSWFGSL